MSKRLFLSATAAMWAAQVAAQGIADQAARDEIVFMSSEEPAMRKAFARAAQTLPDFLKDAANPAVGTSNYSLKVAISDGTRTEYFWVGDFVHEGDTFHGTLNNEPRLVKKHKLGDRITFRRAQIADWAYMDRIHGRMVGNFTACALLTKEPPEQAAAFKKRYGLSCED